MTASLLLDNSAFHRFSHPGLPEERVAEIVTLVEQGRIIVSLPFLVEAGFSARDGRAHADLMAELLAFPQVGFDGLAEQRAIDAQRELAAAGHHRVAPPDLMIAALADRHGLGVLHYDSDYDTIVSLTSLHFDSQWLAPRGSLV